MYNMAMVVTIFARYAFWHYFQAPKLLIGVWGNLLWYIGHIFSVDSLWRSFFSPWKRIVATPTKRWDFEDIASAALANFISRIIGAIMRLLLIVIGRTLQLLWLLVGVAFYASWFFLPFVLVSTLAYGFSLIL